MSLGIAVHGVEVRGHVVIVEHSDHDSEEAADLWHEKDMPRNGAGREARTPGACPALTATLTAKPMDAGGRDGRTGTTSRALVDAVL